jgi:ABC-type enterochelin transport system substrate-binding protein
MATAGNFAFETAFGGRSSENKGPIGAAVSQLSGAGDRLVKSTKEAADSIGGGVRKYKNAKSEEADLDTELDSQTKRETRGKAKGGAVKMAKGGSVSARADGCAQRGKTKGRIV